MTAIEMRFHKTSGVQDQFVLVSQGNPLPVIDVSGGGAVAFTDASGTITVGTYANQQVVAGSTLSAYLYIFNNDVQEVLYVNMTGSAGNGSIPDPTAIPIPPMGIYQLQGTMPSGAINVAANTEGHAFIVKYA